MTLRLVAGADELVLSIENGYFVERWDLGFPAVRASSAPRVQAHGEDDRSAYFGARAVTMDVTIIPESGATVLGLLDDLRAFCIPELRPFLYFELDGEERRVRLRVDNQSAPITILGSQLVHAGWRAPDGVVEAAAEEIVSISAANDDAAGIVFPIVFPLTFPASGVAGSRVITNRGKIAVAPVLRLYGPCTDPRIQNLTTGQTMEFTARGGITLAQGEYLEVDGIEKTVSLNGDVDVSRYNRLDFEVSDWWTLARGENRIRYYPDTFSAPALAEVRYRPAWA